MTTSTQPTPTNLTELAQHSPWCQTSECHEGTPGIEWSHESDRLGEQELTASSWERVSVNVTRHAALGSDGVQQTMRVDLIGERHDSGRWEFDGGLALNPDQAETLAADLYRAVAVARGKTQQ